MTGNEFRTIRRILGYTQKEFSELLKTEIKHINLGERRNKKDISPHLEQQVTNRFNTDMILHDARELKHLPRKERMHEFNVRRLTYDTGRSDWERTG